MTYLFHRLSEVPYLFAAGLLFACTSDPSAGKPDPAVASGGAAAGSHTGSGGASEQAGIGSQGNVSAGGTGGTFIDSAAGGANMTPGGGSMSASGGAGNAGSGADDPLLLQEDAPGFCGVQGFVESTNLGFSGVGYANTENVAGAEIEWTVLSATAQVQTLTFRYAATGARPGKLLINAEEGAGVVDFADTGDFTTWLDSSIEVNLVVGENRISLSATTAAGLPNIDSLSFESGGLQAVQCEREQGTVGPITIWIAGDSTVANGETPCPTGWGAFFAAQFSDQVTVSNRAVGGRSVRTWLYDVTDQLGGDGECVLNEDGSNQPIIQTRWTDMLTQMKEGDYLFIQFGINDGSSTCPRHVGGEQLKEEYAYMAEEAQSRGVKPVFVTPVSAIGCSGTTAVGTRGFITETKSVGQQLQVPVIDLHQLSIDLYNELGFCPVSGGDVSASTNGPVGDFFCDDHTHFSDAGAERIAQLMAEAVASAGLPLSTELK